MEEKRNKDGKKVGELTTDKKKFLISIKGTNTWITANADMTLKVTNE